MAIVGIDRITYGVASMAKARRFFDDWGLALVSAEADRVLYRTRNNAEVLVMPAASRDLPKAVHRGSTVREITWGVKTKRDLAALRKTLARDRAPSEDADGTIHATDPVGLGVAFRVTRRTPYKDARAPLNAPGKVERFNRRATFYDRATPQTIGHTVWLVNDVPGTARFYTECLGFHITDSYTDDGGVFMRCAAEGGHHNHVLFKSPDGKQRLDHVAYLVRDINEVMAGGLYISRKGWKTMVGPGRHWMSSAYFWYFDNPAGAMAEYFTDEDHVGPGWKPGEFKRSRGTFAEWFLPGGLPA